MALSGIWQHVSGEYLRIGGALVSGNPAIDKPTRDRRLTQRRSPFAGFHASHQPAAMDGFTGPSIKSLDLTLAKEFKITERLAFELRMESYNLPNPFIGPIRS
jgi:hypothetical protein